jgi:hypothetical protein
MSRNTKKGWLIDAIADALHKQRGHYALAIRDTKGRWTTVYQIAEDWRYEIVQVLLATGTGQGSRGDRRKTGNETREILNGSARSAWNHDGTPGSMVGPDADKWTLQITTKCGTQTKQIKVNQRWGAERVLEALRASWRPIAEMQMQVTNATGRMIECNGVKEDLIFELVQKERRTPCPKRMSRLDIHRVPEEEHREADREKITVKTWCNGKSKLYTRQGRSENEESE